MPTQPTREEKVLQYAKAIWESDVKAGWCSTDWPITVEMERHLLTAASAAYGAMTPVEGPNFKRLLEKEAA